MGSQLMDDGCCTCLVPNVPNSRLSKIQETSLPIYGGRLFKDLLKDIRNLTYVIIGAFKRAVNQFLKTIPDEPQINEYTAQR